MKKLPAKEDGRKYLADNLPHLVDFIPFLAVLNEESDRGRALVAASFLENQLQDIISAYLVRGTAQRQLLEGFNAPIGSLSTKIVLASALGLISDGERRECDLIRKVRNKFAHNVHASFEDADIRDICGGLSFAAANYGSVVVPAVGRFTTSSVALISRLNNRAIYASRVRLKVRRWED
ncbi:MAG: hypothetical protein SFV20_10515 [Sphingopyxis sp.]|nr:hypothetical protein [Sphingopyxis sp.]